MPFCVPHMTEGGPANEAKQSFLARWWEAPRGFDSAFVQLQCHRATYAGPLYRWSVAEQRRVRWANGSPNTEPYRILFRLHPSYVCIATASTYREIQADWALVTEKVIPALLAAHPEHTLASLEADLFRHVLNTVIGEFVDAASPEALLEFEARVREVQGMTDLSAIVALREQFLERCRRPEPPTDAVVLVELASYRLAALRSQTLSAPFAASSGPAQAEHGAEDGELAANKAEEPEPEKEPEPEQAATDAGHALIFGIDQLYAMFDHIDDASTLAEIVRQAQARLAHISESAVSGGAAVAPPPPPPPPPPALAPPPSQPNLRTGRRGGNGPVAPKPIDPMAEMMEALRLAVERRHKAMQPVADTEPW